MQTGQRGSAMLADFWSFLLDENNRTVLAWVGGGIVVVVGAIWAVLKFFVSERAKEGPSAPTVKADQGGVAAGRDIRDSEIDTRGGGRR
jgi:hypothetical protein